MIRVNIVIKFVFHTDISNIEMNGFVDFFKQICAYKYVLGHHTKIIIFIGCYEITYMSLSTTCKS